VYDKKRYIMKVKYNRVSTLNQSGNRFQEDINKYDFVFMDVVSGSVKFFDRKYGGRIKELVEKGEISEIVCEELSRLGRNTGDVISTLEYFEEHKVNVFVRNIGLYSRPNGEKNPIWKMITSVMSSIYEMELENIKERTRVGQMVYINNGGRMGRPVGTSTNDNDFLKKEKTKKVMSYLKKDYSVREISKICGVSLGLVMKVKKTTEKLQLI
jgi:DNA invertase Pin-like site-specific DNA recombinase